MPSTSNFTGSLWFVSLVALLVSLGAQVLIGALTPVTALDWLSNDFRQDPVVLVAGQTSFWRGDALIRSISFGIGTAVACLLTKSQSWRLTICLVAIAGLSTAFAQFPGPATPMQLAVWTASAPAATLAVSMFFRLWKRDV